MKCHSCDSKATFHFTFACQRKFVEQRHVCEEHAHPVLMEYFAKRLPPAGERTRNGDAVEFDVEAVITCETEDHQVVYLHEVGGGRRLPMFTGSFPAAAIERKLEGLPSPRPLTHDAMAATIAALGGRLQSVIIADVRAQTYFSTLRIDQAGHLREVDVQPGDALVLALTCGSPIFVSEQVLQHVFAHSSQDSP